jgi:hypothetical protein
MRHFRSSDPEERSAAFVREAQKAGMVMLLCIAIWLAAGAGAFWPGWVVLALGIRLAALARQAYGQPDRIDA